MPGHRRQEHDNPHILVVSLRTGPRTLHAELAGYVEYAQRVRCRLLPGVW